MAFFVEDTWPELSGQVLGTHRHCLRAAPAQSGRTSPVLAI